jgi:GTP cyclohydrolase II
MIDDRERDPFDVTSLDATRVAMPPTRTPDRLVDRAPRLDPLIRLAPATLPSRHGSFDVTVFRRGTSGEEILAISKGDLGRGDDAPLFVRVHSECFTGEVLGSLKCDCADQLEQALAAIETRGRGIVIYLRQEGRGIGLGNKIRAYALQSAGLDTIEANHQLGFATDLRDFSVAGEILTELGARRVELHTNNPDKVRALEEHNIEVTRVAAHGRVNHHNRDYLETKHRVLGHDLTALFEASRGDTRAPKAGELPIEASENRRR